MPDHVRITLSAADMAAMTEAQLTSLLMAAYKVEATAVVRRKDGSVKYDRPELQGQYGEEYLTGDGNG
jgi:hypothetical protein